MNVHLGVAQGPHEHLVQPQAVGAEAVHYVVRVDDVATAFGHLERPRRHLRAAGVKLCDMPLQLRNSITSTSASVC